MLGGFGQGFNSNINQTPAMSPGLNQTYPTFSGFGGGTQAPSYSTLPVNTTSTQANAVLDPYQGQTLNFDSQKDMRNFQNQQRYITDPNQQYMNQELIRRMGHNMGIRGNEAQQQYMQNNYSMLPTTYQRNIGRGARGGYDTRGEYTALAKPKQAFYQMNPTGGITNLLG